jgi:polyisoprenoid-binding protein YceI
MRMTSSFLPAVSLLLALPLTASVQTMEIDSTHTVLGFKASTVLFDVPGHFDHYQASISGDPVTLKDVSVRVEVDVSSINTGIGKRDEHLRSADFFDAAKYPKIVFTANQARREGGKLLLKGTLTLRGVSKPVEIPFQEAQGLNGADTPTWSYRAAVPLNRLDFGLGRDSVAAKLSLKDDVELDLLLVGFF